MNAPRLLGLDAKELEKLTVWNKGRRIDGFSAETWRWDDFGHVIRFADYGDRSSNYGWEIDHITPTALGGLDIHANKRPLHCARNASLGGILAAFISR